jgi:hypothetical protein
VLCATFALLATLTVVAIRRAGYRS